MNLWTDNLPHQEAGYDGRTTEPSPPGAHHLGESRRGVARAPTAFGRTLPCPPHGASAGGPAAGAHWPHRSPADRLSGDSAPGGVGGCPYRASPLPALVSTRARYAAVGGAGGSRPSAARRRVAGARGRYGPGQSPQGRSPGGPHPARPRGKGGKRRRGGEATGGPRGATRAGANVQATTLVAATLEALVVERPRPTTAPPQPRWVDQGDDPPTGQETGAAYPAPPPIRRRGEGRLEAHGATRSPARRGVVERPLGWLSNGRGLLGRYEKQARKSLGLLQFACA